MPNKKKVKKFKKILLKNKKNSVIKINHTANDLTEIFNLANYLLEDNINLTIKKSTKKDFNEIVTSEADSQYFLENYLKSSKKFIEKKLDNNLINRSSPYLLDLKKYYQQTNLQSLQKIDKSVKKFLIFKFLTNIITRFKDSDTIIYKLKPTIIFLLIGLLLTIPLSGLTQIGKLELIKNQVSIKSAQALTEIKNATVYSQQQNFLQASNNFHQAALNFQRASEILNESNNFFWQLLKYFPFTDNKINSIKNLLNASQNIAVNAGVISQLVEKNNSINQINLLDQLKQIEPLINETNQQLFIINNSLAEFNFKFIPENLKKDYQQLTNQLPQLKNNLQTLSLIINVIKQILAENTNKQYLIFFQNTNELRATGGFMGSFALIQITDGEIKKIDIPGGGPYDLKIDLTKKIISPWPMHLIGSRWQIWDANWWPDFPTSAKKIMWFYEQSGGATVDGVITINSAILPDLLKLTDDIYLEKYNTLLTSQNIIATLQYAVEFEYDKTLNQPKQIIADLAPILIDKLVKIDQAKIPQLLLLLNQSLKTKDIQMYFLDQNLENKIIELGWGGEIKETTGDYLMVVNQNIGGGKTDGVILQTVNLEVTINLDGTIINKVVINRQHQGSANDLLEKTNNVSFIRLSVPQNSQLIEASGNNPPPAEAFKNIESDFYPDEDFKKISGEIYFDEKFQIYINQEFGKTVFGQWQQLKPGENKILTFKYQLPFKMKINSFTNNFLYNLMNYQKPPYQTYQLLIQKQSGTKNYFNLNIKYPNNKKIIWQQSTLANRLNENNNIIINSPLFSDQTLAVILE